MSPGVIKISSSDQNFTFNKSQISVTIGDILTPINFTFGYSIVRSYDTSGALVSENDSYVIFVLSCNPPCWNCTSNPNQCTSCYDTKQNFTNFIYFTPSNSSNVYGTCNTSCSSGYFSDVNNPYYCLLCDKNCK